MQGTDLVVTDTADALQGGAGNDTLDGGPGANVSGNDYLDGELGDDFPIMKKAA